MLRRVLPILVLLSFTSAACTPAAAPTAVEASPTVPPTDTALPTSTQAPTSSPTATARPLPTETFTAQPSSTFTPLPFLPPTFTHRPVKQKPSASPSPTSTATLATDTLTPGPSPTYTSTFCPLPTPEPLWVEPVISPTDLLSQQITVHVGYGTEVTISTESGVFTVTGSFGVYANPALVEIVLLPNTTHHLEVSVRVEPPTYNGCTYSSYTLQTTYDQNGTPLVIVQGTPVP